jgi:hypothetical protein
MAKKPMHTAGQTSAMFDHSTKTTDKTDEPDRIEQVGSRDRP